MVASLLRWNAARHPSFCILTGAIIVGSIRRRFLRRFPYGLLYRVKPERVRVLAVMNLKRRPSYWVGRV